MPDSSANWLIDCFPTYIFIILLTGCFFITDFLLESFIWLKLFNSGKFFNSNRFTWVLFKYCIFSSNSNDFMFAKGMPTTITHLPKSSEKLIPLTVFNHFQCFEFRIIAVHPNYFLGGIKINPIIFDCSLNSSYFTKPVFSNFLILNGSY